MKANEHADPVEIFDGSYWQAEMVKTLLENEDIEAFLKDETLGTLTPWFPGDGATGSVKIFVSKGNAHLARTIVSEYKKNLKASV